MADISHSPEERRLTLKQQRFVDAYLGAAKGNATEAARLAGYSATNRASLAEQGSQNLRKPEIQAAIKERVSELAMTAEEVLGRLADQARGDLGDFLDAKTYGRPVITLDRAQGKTHLIKRYQTGVQGTSIELYDAQAALVHIGKYHKLFTDVSEVKQEISADDITERLIGRIHKVADEGAAEGLPG